MAQDDKTFDISGGEHEEIVPAVFARSAEEAEVYCELLNDHDIPAVVGDDDDVDTVKARGRARRRSMTHGVPILVPEVLLDDAGQVIAVQEELEEFGTADAAEDPLDEDDDFGLSELDETYDDELYEDAGPLSDEDDDL